MILEFCSVWIDRAQLHSRNARNGLRQTPKTAPRASCNFRSVPFPFSHTHTHTHTHTCIHKYHRGRLDRYPLATTIHGYIVKLEGDELVVCLPFPAAPKRSPEGGTVGRMPCQNSLKTGETNSNMPCSTMMSQVHPSLRALPESVGFRLVAFLHPRTSPVFLVNTSLRPNNVRHHRNRQGQE